MKIKMHIIIFKVLMLSCFASRLISMQPGEGWIIQTAKNLVDQFNIERATATRELEDIMRRRIAVGPVDRTQSIEHLHHVFPLRPGVAPNLRNYIREAVNNYTGQGEYGAIIGAAHRVRLSPGERDNFINLCGTIIDRERFRPDYYVFYHSTNPWVGLLNDICSEMYCWINLLPKSNSLTIFRPRVADFRNFTINNLYNLITARTDGALERNTQENDHSTEFRDRGIAVNLALFGSFYAAGESAIPYFINPGSTIDPTLGDPSEITQGRIVTFLQDNFHVNPDRVRPLVAGLVDNYMRSRLYQANRLYQIFVEKGRVNQIAYPSRSYGKRLGINGYRVDDNVIPEPLPMNYVLQLYLNNFTFFQPNIPLGGENDFISALGEIYDIVVQRRVLLDVVQARLLADPRWFSDSNIVETGIYFWPGTVEGRQMMEEYRRFRSDDELRKLLKPIQEELIKDMLRNPADFQNISTTPIFLKTLDARARR